MMESFEKLAPEVAQNRIECNNYKFVKPTTLKSCN